LLEALGEVGLLERVRCSEGAAKLVLADKWVICAAGLLVVEVLPWRRAPVLEESWEFFLLFALDAVVKEVSLGLCVASRCSGLDIPLSLLPFIALREVISFLVDSRGERGGGEREVLRGVREGEGLRIYAGVMFSMEASRIRRLFCTRATELLVLLFLLSSLPLLGTTLVRSLEVLFGEG
jgi:hypothetical protein